MVHPLPKRLFTDIFDIDWSRMRRSAPSPLLERIAIETAHYYIVALAVLREQEVSDPASVAVELSGQYMRMFYEVASINHADKNDDEIPNS
jgi:hypothetical protein